MKRITRKQINDSIREFGYFITPSGTKKISYSINPLEGHKPLANDHIYVNKLSELSLDQWRGEVIQRMKKTV